MVRATTEGRGVPRRCARSPSRTATGTRPLSLPLVFFRGPVPRVWARVLESPASMLPTWTEHHDVLGSSSAPGRARSSTGASTVGPQPGGRTRRQARGGPRRRCSGAPRGRSGRPANRREASKVAIGPRAPTQFRGLTTPHGRDSGRAGWPLSSLPPGRVALRRLDGRRMGRPRGGPVRLSWPERPAGCVPGADSDRAHFREVGRGEHGN